VEPRRSPLPYFAPQKPSTRAGLDFVVIDVETACHRVSSTFQIGIVGFRDGPRGADL
jgi:DNA polymerase-3 subunit epsilon